MHVGAHRREYLIEMFLLRKFRFTSVSLECRALGATDTQNSPSPGGVDIVACMFSYRPIVMRY